MCKEGKQMFCRVPPYASSACKIGYSNETMQCFDLKYTLV